MSFLALQNVTRRYGSTAAVDSVSLELERGEIFGLLGPSGCGKTTTLRIIAGLETPEAGSIEFNGHDITRTSPESRGFGMVFQNYALFPHLNVLENVAFGLRARRLPADVIARRVESSLALVQLPGFGHRRVDELSGGQQQRVAIARAISIEPALLLFDEPLSNLDIELREQTRGELRQIVKRLGLTAVYVTHDQDEAFALCDRISVMSDGKILQTGQSREIYERPANISVARFLGRNNFIEAMRLSSKGEPSRKVKTLKFKTLRGAHSLTVTAKSVELGPINKPAMLAIRPEHLVLSSAETEAENEFSASIVEKVFSGATTALTLDSNGLRLEALVLHADGFSRGQTFTVRLPADRILVLNA